MISATVDVPEALVGRFIGARGTNINRLRSETHARIDIANPAPTPGPFRSISIHGTAQAIEQIKAEVANITKEFDKRIREKAKMDNYRRKRAINKGHATTPPKPGQLGPSMRSGEDLAPIRHEHVITTTTADVSRRVRSRSRSDESHHAASRSRSPIRATDASQRGDKSALDESHRAASRSRSPIRATDASQRGDQSALIKTKTSRRVRNRLRSDEYLHAASSSHTPTYATNGSLIGGQSAPSHDPEPAERYRCVIFHIDALLENRLPFEEMAWNLALREHFGDFHFEETIAALDVRQYRDEEALDHLLSVVKPPPEFMSRMVPVLEELPGVDAGTNILGNGQPEKRFITASEHVLMRKRAYYEELCSTDDAVETPRGSQRGLSKVKGIRSLLVKLNQERWKLGVVHPGTREQCDFDLKAIGLQSLFHTIVSAESCTSMTRPYESLFEESMTRLRVLGSGVAVCRTPLSCLDATSAGIFVIHLNDDVRFSFGYPGASTVISEPTGNFVGRLEELFLGNSSSLHHMMDRHSSTREVQSATGSTCHPSASSNIAGSKDSVFKVGELVRAVSSADGRVYDAIVRDVKRIRSASSSGPGSGSGFESSETKTEVFVGFLAHAGVEKLPESHVCKVFVNTPSSKSLQGSS